MNKLDQHLSVPGAARSLARSIGVADAMVSQWRSGKKTPAPITAVAIEAALGGAIRRWDLRPDDWHLIWPELIGADGAPPVSVEKAA
jgi:DNA-binding transcriptional regulator YdaS (Cro superfamily)